MGIRSCRQYNDYFTDMDSVSQSLASSNSGCDSRYRSIITKLDDMITLIQRQPDCNLTKEMDQLLDSMMEHFCSENNVLNMVDFPHSTAHRFHHYSIFTDTAEVRHLFSKGEDALSDRLSRIRLTFLEHISVHDRVFEEFLMS